GCIVAVARKNLWDELVAACERIVDEYEQEYLRRLFWAAESPAKSGGSGPQGVVHKAVIVERGTPDRLLFELRFNTDLPAIYFHALDPFETSGVITLVLDEQDEVRLCYRGVLMEPLEIAKVLLAPVLFRVGVYHRELKDDFVDIAHLRGAYGEGAILSRRTLPRSKPQFSRPSSERTHRDLQSTWPVPRGAEKPSWLRYTLAATTVLVATGFLFLLQSLTAVPIFWVLLAPIVFAFIQWGAGPGVLALAIGIFNTDFFFVVPLWEFNFEATTRLLALAYALIAFSAYWISDRRRVSEHL
ncbi:MAG TPA: DUF4118 domain-containing protein, partial [Bryobacteraceae bacterium]